LSALEREEILYILPAIPLSYKSPQTCDKIKRDNGKLDRQDGAFPPSFFPAVLG
jgi:hypothetical protein